MIVIEFLVFLLKAFGLIFILGMLLNLILDVVIIQPIENRHIYRQKRKLMDMLIKKIESGEDISGLHVDILDKNDEEIEEKYGEEKIEE